MQVGWIGLGNIGLPMAQRIASGDHDLVVVGHRNQEALAAVRAAGARVVDTPRAVAEGSDVVVSMVRDEPQTDAVLLGETGAIAGLRPGAVLMIMSTLSPGYCQRIAEMCALRGAQVLDAPVSGGSPRALDGTLSIMVGGSIEAIDRARPVIERLGTSIFRLGEAGAGQTAKIVNNAVKIAIVAATTEGLDVGVHAGLDLEALIQVLLHSTARSQVLENWDYYYAFKRDHHPGGPLDILYKDVRLLLGLAGALEVDTPVVRVLEQVDVGRLVGAPAQGAGVPGTTIDR